ncbi:S-adenosylmethionine transporter [Coemansia javaensis]|uniref:S-adenosylmethionine transporter n=1 Tax=Coemansia javaensis TaxID=2761396 RepID=A0A9W8LNM8_9FUNG|nr:S-adenosylmethionine transporter [Coemansia javaensis]
MPHETAGPSMAQCLAAGGIAGMAVDTALFPLDTIKTRLQARAGFLASGGFRGIYSGLSSAIVGSAPGAAVFFVTYEQTKAALAWLPEHQQPAAHMAAASLGEVAACLVRVPTEVVKQRLQANHHRSLPAAVRAIRAADGLRGFYRGYLTQVVREIPFTCIQFPIYESLKRWHARRQGRPVHSWEAALCGSFAGATAAAATTPLDVVKTRVMLSTTAAAASGATATAAAHGPAYVGVVATLARIVREEGARALFSGLVPRTLWISAGGFVFLGSYEKARRCPTVYWAQREGLVYLTIDLHDAQDAKITLAKDTIDFSNTTDGMPYAFHLDFFGAVNPDDAKKSATGRKTLLVINKAKDEWWPRLTKESPKPPFVKTDFDHWKEDDDSEDEAPAFPGMDFSSLGGMSGMGGMGGMGGMPDLSSLSGMDGMPDLGGDDSGDDDDAAAAAHKDGDKAPEAK